MLFVLGVIDRRKVGYLVTTLAINWRPMGVSFALSSSIRSIQFLDGYLVSNPKDLLPLAWKTGSARQCGKHDQPAFALTLSKKNF